MGSKLVKSIFSIILVTLTGCSGNPPGLENPAGINGNLSQNEFKTESLDVTYLARKLETFLPQEQGIKLVRELLYDSYKQPDLAREACLLKPAIYEGIIINQAVIDRRAIDEAFNQFIASLEPPAPVKPLAVGSLVYAFSFGEEPRGYFNVRPDGSHNVQLGPFKPSNPSGGITLIPDGTRSRVIYSAFDGSTGRQDVFISDVDGKNLFNVTEKLPTTYNDVPELSPDGSRVAVFAQGDETTVYTLKLDGSDPINIKSKLGFSDDLDYYRLGGSLSGYTPDGKLLLNRGIDGTGVFKGIYKVNFDGTGVANLTAGSNDDAKYYISFSPDYSRICFLAGPDINMDKIFIADADGSNAQTINFPESGRAFGAMPFSPDSSKIALNFQTADGDGWVVNSDNTNLKNLNIENSYGEQAFINNEKIVFTFYLNPPNPLTSLAIVNADGSGSITAGSSITRFLTLLPSGKFLASKDTNVRNFIYRFDAGGNGTATNYPYRFILSEDKTKMFFSDSDPNHSSTDIYVMDVDPDLETDGTNLTDLTNTGNKYETPLFVVK
jgi:hypothetical protein